MRNKILQEIFQGFTTADTTVLGRLDNLDQERRADDKPRQTPQRDADVFANLNALFRRETAGSTSLGSTTNLQNDSLPEKVVVTPSAAKLVGSTASLTDGIQASSTDGFGIGSQVIQSFADVSKNIDRMRAATETSATVMSENTAAITSNTASKSVGQALASTGKTVASSFLGGLSAIPLISGIFKLFGGGGEAEKQAPLEKYAAPAPLAFNVAAARGSGDERFEETSYDIFGKARVPAANVPVVPAYGTLLASVPPLSAVGSKSGSDDLRSLTQSEIAIHTPDQFSQKTATQVTVNVQAMDSRSFMDRSSDIAQAVREAMLNMHSINDVVNDL